MSTLTNRNRSRYARARHGRPPVISARDVEIFKLLDRYRLLRSGAIRAFFPGSDRGDLLDRLRRLYDFGYVNRLDGVARYRIAREMQSVYELDALGAQELRQRGLLREERAGSRTAIGNFHHTLMICDVLASIEIGCLRSGPVASNDDDQRTGDGLVGSQCGSGYRFFRPGVGFITQQEIIDKAPCRELEKPMTFPINDQIVKNVTPDAIFGLEYGDGTRRYFALEADRGSEPIYRRARGKKQSSVVRKFDQYRALLASDVPMQHLGLKEAPLFPMFVTVSAERLRKMRHLLTTLTNGKGNSRILFKVMKGDGCKAPPHDGHMLFEEYVRAGHAPFRIAVK